MIQPPITLRIAEALKVPSSSQKLGIFDIPEGQSKDDGRAIARIDPKSFSKI